MSMTSVARQTKQAAIEPAQEGASAFSFCFPTRALTLDGFREWATSPEFPENIRAAFIVDEVFIEMSNEDPEVHVIVKTVFIGVLYHVCQELNSGRLYQDGMLLTNVDASVSNNPDASFISYEALRSGRVRIVPRPGKANRFKELVGTPDWVLEVVCDSSVERDTEKLRVAYHRAGIREYWLVDARGDEIVFQILHWRKKGYAAAPVKDGWQKSRVFGREFRLTRKKNDIGLWDYALGVRLS